RLSCGVCPRSHRSRSEDDVLLRNRRGEVSPKARLWQEADCASQGSLPRGRPHEDVGSYEPLQRRGDPTIRKYGWHRLSVDDEVTYGYRRQAEGLCCQGFRSLKLITERCGSPAWIRTTIHGSKGRCPTIRRPGINCLACLFSLSSP